MKAAVELSQACRYRQAGFVLITVLWVITALAALLGLSMAATRLGNQMTINRIVLTRGRWAAEACLAILQARWVEQRLPDTSTVDFGSGFRCAWSVENPSARVNLNKVDQGMLLALGLREPFVHGVLIRRRERAIVDIGELRDLPGFDTTLLSIGTVVGPGSIDLSVASRRVLLALPGMTPEAVDVILYRRRVGHATGSLDELASQLSPPARAALLAHYDDLAQTATFAPSQLVLHVEGWVEGYSPRATIEEVVVPSLERLAVVRRRMW